VHLPATGAPPAAIRQRWGRSLVLGCSTHSLAEIAEHREVVDYVCFGPIFPTPSKPDATPVGTGPLAAAARLGPAVFALGGVDTPARVDQVLAAGASGVAGIRLFADPAARQAVLRQLDEDRSVASSPSATGSPECAAPHCYDPAP
jgi:thiamine-phosphate pyrophosphorylase